MKSKAKVSHLLYCCLILLTILISTSCITPYYRTHNQKEAAVVAKAFAESAFVGRNKEQAFSYLRKDVNAQFTVGSLEEIVKKMHPENKYPQIIIPIEYEIVPNSGVIRIFLKGELSNQEAFYYMIAVVKQDDEYRVSELFRNNVNSPYPKSALRKSF